ncbi:MAG: hypothetical protein EBR82_67005 [Caulobacteraceae bacterium]|nr:hypothetical protein [Caulobacteraceae bacterium]
MLTDEQKRRINQAIDETHKLIAKEMEYSPQFRKQNYLRQLDEHLTKLLTMLENEQWIKIQKN